MMGKAVAEPSVVVNEGLGTDRLRQAGTGQKQWQGGGGAGWKILDSCVHASLIYSECGHAQK